MFWLMFKKFSTDKRLIEKEDLLIISIFIAFRSEFAHGLD